MRWSWLLVPLVIGACSDDPAPASQPTAPAPDAGATCEEGERPAAEGCEPILPEGECGPGTRAELGTATCVPVGPTGCPTGFEAHASGWGCMPVLPATACEGATRDALGAKTCVPIGDCNAPFPPAGASVFVDASFGAGQLDATHVKTIAEAISTAPANATIAIAPGTYPENLSITKNLTLAGKCAAQVIVDAPATGAGISVNGGKATIRGVTVRGGAPGISALSAASAITIEDALLDANVRAGIDAFEEAKVDARRVVIRKTTPAASSSTTNGIIADVTSTVAFEDGAIVGASDAGVGATGSSSITLTRSVVRNVVPRADGVGGSGARGFERGKIVLVESAIVASRGVGVLVGKTKASLKMDRSSVVDLVGDDRALGIGIAVSVGDGASAEISGSTLAHNPGSGFVVSDAGTVVKITSSAVVDTYAAGEAASGVALSARDGVNATFDSSVVYEATFDAIQSGSAGTKLSVTKSLVASTRSSPGRGKIAKGTGGEAIIVVRGGSAAVSSCTILDVREGGLAAGNAGSVLTVDRTYVRGTRVNDAGAFGHGVMALDHGAITVSRSAVDESAGIGVVFANASGAVGRTSIRRNAVGIHTQQGSELVESADIPDPLDPGTVVVTPDSRFIENASKLGSGEVPLPAIVPAL